MTVSWPEAGDDVGVVGYRLWLNGFFVLATQQTRATLSWFNDSDTHVVQVRAVDAAGNLGPSSPTLLVTRPTPSAQPSSWTTSAPAELSPTQSTTTQKPPESPTPPPVEASQKTPDTNVVAPYATSAASDLEEDGS